MNGAVKNENKLSFSRRNTAKMEIFHFGCISSRNSTKSLDFQMFLFFLTLEKLVFTMFQRKKCSYGLFFMTHFQFFVFVTFPLSQPNV